MLTFSDGMKFDTNTPPHLEQRSDGWYIVGNGMLVPVDSEKKGKELLQKVYKK